MLRVALTGNIASGKSTVQEILEAKGLKVLDTDKVAHEILEISDEVKTAFPDCIENGKICRNKLGKLVFNNEKSKQKLESIIHPEIRAKIMDFFTENETQKVCFVGIPLLYEAGMQDLFDKALLIYTDDVIREDRLISRNNYTLQYARLRMNSQISQDEKLHLCDYVIYNNGSIDELKVAVDKFLSKI